MPFRTLTLPPVRSVVGVDFSGAAQSGKTAWMAETGVTSGSAPLKLQSLQPLGRVAGSDDRADVCAALVNRIAASRKTAWGIDFPFGLPIELELGDWPDQLRHVADYWGDARQYGRELVAISQQVGGKMHLRRDTDVETQTPFDCYHYRIIYQTFHGMRDVLAPLAKDRKTAVLPFHYRRVRQAERLVLEACPASTLKRMGLPHRLYKQSGGKPPSPIHVKHRQAILRGLSTLVDISAHRRRVILADSGGDALDAVLAAVGTWYAVRNTDHLAVANHPRYHREGHVYC